MTASIPSKTPAETLGEEIASAVTHGIGAALSVAGLVVMIVLAVLNGTVWSVVGVSIFGAALILLYLSSTLYHGIPHPGAKRVFRLLDHSMIYLLIAGTYTPFVLLYFDGGWVWTMLCLEWGIALAGVVYKLFFLGRHPILSTTLYLAMGWLAVVGIEPLLSAAPVGCLAWMAAGGLCYTAGVAFYAWERLPFNHAIWHVFVLAGSLCHYLALTLYL